MTALTWDDVGKRTFETGVDRGVLYTPSNGVYNTGVAWNGLTTVTESPDGAEATPQYADNIKYLNLVGSEDLGGTIEAFTYPPEFALCDGTASPQPGVNITQQTRKIFGMSYRTRLGNDVSSTDYGYKLHLLYGALAKPSEKAYGTINDSPEAIAFSWEFTTTPVLVTGLKPTALVVVDTTKVSAANLAALEQALYGSAGADPRLPLPDEVLGMFSGSLQSVTPTEPTYNSSTHVISVPSQTGVVWRRSDTNAVVPGGSNITLTSGQSLVLQATPAAGYTFPSTADDDFSYSY